MNHSDVVADEFVERFLETGSATEQDIQHLVRAVVREGVRLDYKGGDWLSSTKPATRGSPTKPGARLRKWTAGFANAEGGVLIVGVDESDDKPQQLNPKTCSEWEPDPAKLQRKAEDALQAIATQLDIPPRISVIPVQGGALLLVGVERNSRLVECVESGGPPVYYLRTFDGTVCLPDAVAVDLLVGRRARPVLRLRVILNPVQSGPQQCNFIVQLRLANDGLIWLDDLRVGVVFPAASPDRTLVDSIARYVDCTQNINVSGVAARADPWGPLAPFATIEPIARIELPGGPAQWSLAVYVAARAQPPMWWELRGTIAPSPTWLPELDGLPELCTRRRPQIMFAAG